MTEDSFRFGLRLADGSELPLSCDPYFRGEGRVIVQQRPDPSTSTRFSLLPQGGSGDSRKFTFGYWFSPLPPSGRLAFVCSWPRYGIEETETVIDADVILEAARQAVPIWPDDVGLEEGHTE
jgi:hypothetical protein